MKRVVIVGASSAGLYCAWKLASAGIETWLIDPSTSYCKANRTLIITPSFWHFLPDFPRHYVRNWIYGFHLIQEQTELRIPLKNHDLVIDRAELLNFLYHRVLNTKVRLLRPARFLGISGSNQISFRMDQDTRDFIDNVTHLILADGVHSPASRYLGLPLYPSLPVLQARVEPPNGFNPNWATCWFDPHKTPFFYWYIPHNSNEGVLGVVTKPNQPIRYLLDEFADFHGFKLIDYQSGRVASFHPRIRFSFKMHNIKIYRIGDAGGHVKVTTVGGTVSGLWSADNIVGKILENPYLQTKGLYKELLIHWIIRRILNQFRSRDYEFLMRNLGPQLIRFLGEIPRDNIGKYSMKLFFTQPALFFRFIGYLF